MNNLTKAIFAFYGMSTTKSRLKSFDRTAHNGQNSKYLNTVLDEAKQKRERKYAKRTKNSITK